MPNVGFELTALKSRGTCFIYRTSPAPLGFFFCSLWIPFQDTHLSSIISPFSYSFLSNYFHSIILQSFFIILFFLFFTFFAFSSLLFSSLSHVFIYPFSYLIILITYFFKNFFKRGEVGEGQRETERESQVVSTPSTELT